MLTAAHIIKMMEKVTILITWVPAEDAAELECGKMIRFMFQKTLCRQKKLLRVLLEIYSSSRTRRGKQVDLSLKKPSELLLLLENHCIRLKKFSHPIKSYLT